MLAQTLGSLTELIHAVENKPSVDEEAEDVDEPGHFITKIDQVCAEEVSISFHVMFVCCGLMSLHLGSYRAMPACSNGTLTIVLPHWNAIRPVWEILPRSSTHNSERSTSRCYYGGSQSDAM